MHRVSFCAAVFVSCCVAGCFVPDTEAVSARIRDCNISPQMPSCCFQDEDCSATFYGRYVAEKVTTQEQQDCVLATDCEGEAIVDGQSALLQCLDEPAFGEVELSACEQDCFDVFIECGGAGGTCGVDVAAGCNAEEDACIAACDD